MAEARVPATITSASQKWPKIANMLRNAAAGYILCHSNLRYYDYYCYRYCDYHYYYCYYYYLYQNHYYYYQKKIIKHFFNFSLP
jgi:hypothetical protein